MNQDTDLAVFHDLPVFALNTVLFPGGVLPLRVFEARYMDMARDCLAKDKPFGVCLIVEGREVGEAARHEAVGCTARIADWDMQQLGLLHLRAIGGQRFRVSSRRVQPDGLVRVDAEPIDDDPEIAVPPEFDSCATLVRRLVDDLVEREPDAIKRMIAEPYDYGSAAWIGNRLCEFLPISSKARQKLMELDDPLARLQVIHQYLQQHQII
ncbi:MAG TPA: LON peptidase substrate-binding domain-containing protein [Burkholderiaceae bacterium]|nr:LON peptidase substrate-binding domain-containing protein [Burkholderiaceae bacterium]